MTISLPGLDVPSGVLQMAVSADLSRRFLMISGAIDTNDDGEVRPGEAALKMFTIECGKRRNAISHGRFTAPPDESPEKVRNAVRNGMPRRPATETVVPVTVIG